MFNPSNVVTAVIKEKVAKAEKIVPVVEVETTPYMTVCIPANKSIPYLQFNQAAIDRLSLKVKEDNIAVVQSYQYGEGQTALCVVANVQETEFVNALSLSNRSKKFPTAIVQNTMRATNTNFAELIQGIFNLTDEAMAEGVKFELTEACDEDGHVQLIELSQEAISKLYPSDSVVSEQEAAFHELVEIGTRIHDNPVENKEELLAETEEVVTAPEVNQDDAIAVMQENN
jgi:hypothetical protein